jgi:uncharacterized membrane protein YdbT with pleckstrin-like domain
MAAPGLPAAARGPLRSAPVDPEPGEQVFFHGHPSWRAMLAFYIKGLMLTVLGGVIAGVVTTTVKGSVNVPTVAAVVVVVFAALLIIGVVRRITTTYTITNRRLTIESGLLSRDLHQTRLERVQNVNLRQSMLERILSVGDVDFDTAASAEYDFEFRGVGSPRQIVRTVDRALHELQGTHLQGLSGPSHV